MASKNCIRVFRPSVQQNPYQARAANEKKNTSALYRYDGLYQVTQVSFAEKVSRINIYEALEHLSPIVSRRLYRLSLRRIAARTGAYTNRMADDTFMDYCRSQGKMFTTGSLVAGVPIHNGVPNKKRRKSSDDADNRLDSFDTVPPVQQRRLSGCTRQRSLGCQPAFILSKALYRY
jgi:hypothetical protein